MSKHLQIVGIFCIFTLVLLLAGCERPPEEEAADLPAREEPAPGQEPPESARQPPAPPVTENFEGEPQLSLFPRVASFRPAQDSEEFAFWRTYIEHLHKTSGLAPAGEDGGRAWAIKGLKGLDSVGFFSPLAVDPETTYQVGFSFRGPLPDGGEAGIGILEFDEFLWIGHQFTRDQATRHLTAFEEGFRLREGSDEWQRHTFLFTTSEKTRMIHLVLFRDGVQQREPVLFDDISIAVPEAPPRAAEPSSAKGQP